MYTSHFLRVSSNFNFIEWDIIIIYICDKNWIQIVFNFKLILCPIQVSSYLVLHLLNKFVEIFGTSNTIPP